MSEDPPGLRIAPLTEWLRSEIPDFDASRAPRCELLAGGRSNVSYTLVDAAERRWVLRRPPLGHVLPSAHDMKREYTVLHGLGRVDFPVPTVHAFCADEAVIGAQFIVMDFVDGKVLSSAQETAALGADDADRVSRTLVDTLAALHAVDVAAAGLLEFGRPAGYLRRQVKRWRDQWALTKTRELSSIDELFTWLTPRADAVPDDSRSALVHGDYRLDNVILATDLGQARAVLDWELSTRGDPVADLAVALVYWSEAGDGLRSGLPVARDVTSGPGFWTRRQVIDHYADVSGIDLANLDLCVALACLKLAVIMESIHARSLAGQQIGSVQDDNEDMLGATESLAEMGLRVISEGTVDGLHS